MTDAPRTRSDYGPGGLALVQATCLDLATYLGDYWDDLVIVGGYVPSLLVTARGDVEPHLGTLDLDLGLSIGVVTGERYQEMARRLRQAGYRPDQKAGGQTVHHRWCPPGNDLGVTVDFLIQNPRRGVEAGKPLHLARGFGPIRNDALEAAFADRLPVVLEGLTLREEHVTRTVQVCGPAAFVVLKAHALKSRGLPKDAYDLCYMIRNYGVEGPADVAGRWDLVRSLPVAAGALRILRAEFASRQSLGPKRVAQFHEQDDDEDVRADAVGSVKRLLVLVSTAVPPY